MRPGDRLVCAYVEPHELGQQFTTWPLHVTIVPWFRLDMSPEALAAGFASELRHYQGFMVEVGGEASFGHHARKLVNLVRQPTPLQLIEKSTRQFLRRKQAWLVDETTKTRFDYRPHVTAQGRERLHKGDAFRCDRLYLIEQKGECKEVIGRIQLA